MNTDVKKAVFQAIVSAEDYVQAFENVTRLGLKKQQEREIVKVLIHCCVNEKKMFNKFYGLLASRLCKYDPQSFKYSFKYTLWDYLKSLQNYDLRQIANLARLFGMLFGAGDLPLHFLKVLDFSNLEDGSGQTLSKPQQLFLYLAFDELFTTHPKEDVRKVFLKSLAPSKLKKRVLRGDFDDDDDRDSEADVPEEGEDEEKHVEFKRGFSEYLLTKYYAKKRKEAEKTGGAMQEEVKEKFKAIFDIINR